MAALGQAKDENDRADQDAEQQKIGERDVHAAGATPFPVELNSEGETSVLAGIEDDHPVRKLSRRYLYGWSRANHHDLIAWLFADRQGRNTLKTLRMIERENRRG